MVNNLLHFLKKFNYNKEFRFLKKILASKVNPDEREYIGIASDVYDKLYRVSKSSDLNSMLEKGIIPSSGPADFDESFLDENGSPERRVYFFTNFFSATISIMSSKQDQEELIGGLSKDDEPIIMAIDASKLDRDLVAYKDQEINDLEAIYLTSDSGNLDWVIPSSSILEEETKNTSQILEEDENEYLEEDSYDDDFF